MTEHLTRKFSPPTDGPIINAQKFIFEQLMSGGSPDKALEVLVLAIENLMKDVFCSILQYNRLDSTLHTAAAPSLPREYNQVVNGLKTGPEEGSCGTAAYTKRLVIVSDIQSDPLWIKAKDIAAIYGFRSCWSSPILDKNGDVLGTFALYFKSPRSPSDDELKVISDATAASAVIIEHIKRREKEIQGQKYSEFLSQARKALSSSLNKKVLLTTIQNLIVPKLAEYCEIYLLEDKIKSLSAPSELMEIIKNRPHGTFYHQGLDANVHVFSLMARGHLIGGILISNENEFDKFFFSELAYSCAMALDNAHLYESAQHAIQMRDEFISVASHEFRTPLTILQGRIDLIDMIIQKDSFPDVVVKKITPSLYSAQSQIERFAKLIENLLDVSKIIPAGAQLNKQYISFSALVSEQVALQQLEFKKHACVLQGEIENDIYGFGDKMRLEQVISNLISNALKFGSGKPIHISLKAVSQRAIFEIQDHGIGIPRGDQERIFGRFERSVSDKHFEGLGLGLYICRQLIIAHGGVIKVESEVNQGSKFTIELPLGEDKAL